MRRSRKPRRPVCEPRGAHGAPGLRVCANARNPQAGGPPWNSSLGFLRGRPTQATVPLGRCWSTVLHCAPQHTCAHTHTCTHTLVHVNACHTCTPTPNQVIYNVNKYSSMSSSAKATNPSFPLSPVWPAPHDFLQTSASCNVFVLAPTKRESLS